MNSRLHGGRLLVGVLLAAVLSGCVSLPDSSSVERGREVGVQRSSGQVINRPPGPQPGADASSIVEHYLQAMLSFPPAPAVVRKFLTPQAAHAWVPDAQLRVYEDPVVRSGPGRAVTLQAPVLGSLDARGSWVSSPASTDGVDVALSLLKVGGEWRISNPPAGTLLDTDFFDRYYQQYSLYFFDPTHTILAPDPVYYQLGDAGKTANELVHNLLLGPTEAMGGVVSGEVPSGTRLVGPLTVSPGGLAEVPLGGQVMTMSSAGLRFLAAQLAWTLRQERLGINHVRIWANGEVVAVPDLGEIFAVDAFRGYDPTIFAAKRTLFALDADGHLRSVAPDGSAEKAGAIGDWPARAESAAVDPSGTLGAIVTRGGTRVVVGDVVAGDDASASRWRPDGESLLKPSWDVHGLLWVVDRTSTGARVRVLAAASSGGTDNVHEVVDAPGISDTDDLRAFTLSRDGMRAAVIIGSGSSSRLVLASVRRSATAPTDVSLTNVRDIADGGLRGLTAVAWQTPTTLMVVGHELGSDPQPYEIAIDGSRVRPTTGFLPVRPQYLAAGSNPDVPPVIGSEDGRLYSRTPDERWPLLTARKTLFAPTYVG